MRQKCLIAAAATLLLLPPYASAQDAVTQPAKEPPPMFTGAAPNPRLPAFKNVTQDLSGGRQIAEAWDGKLPRLTIDFRVTAQSSPSKTDADRAAQMTQTVETLRQVVGRQCEIISASIKSGCRIIQQNAAGDFNGRLDARGFARASARAQFELGPMTANSR